MDTTSNPSTIVSNLVGWLFGLVVLAIGMVNTFWGNDPGFGIFIIVLSLAYFPPVNSLIMEKTGLRIPPIAKVLLGALIIWSSLGVGELFDKIDLMMKSL
ncbi:hypothetical protein [Hymenobacter cellulosilyticus]|uniref:Uncharacterized protein n=1 Tax=Hymenobacter cellulosilyticus TaxID=2932248 RepID=A0A8T9PYU7_9BACT|nr:hypothetical protein [Hymenobacter cellulosilyticus]UOQ70414.1 hypothetical protein MUN79_16905 [Hymenobacter cellulosilyticus]